MSSNETFYCPFCGSPQAKGQEFCGSCGANLKSSAPGTTMESKTGQTMPPPAQPGYMPPPGQQPYTYGAPAQTTYVQPPKKDNANIALILGIVSFVIGGIITAIIGLVFVKKAEDANEDRSTIQIAKVLCWIIIAFTIVAIVGYLVMIFGFGYYFW